MQTFSEGVKVVYREQLGYIKYTGEGYVLICVREFLNEPSRNVCLVVPRSQYHEIKLLKQSEK